jgi:hypothetical protein
LESNEERYVFAVFAASQTIKNFAFRQGLRGCVTVSTWGKVRHLDGIWTGSINLTEAGYLKLAEAILVAAEEVKRKGKPATATGGEAKKIRLDQYTGPRNGAGPVMAVVHIFFSAL